MNWIKDVNPWMTELFEQSDAKRREQEVTSDPRNPSRTGRRSSGCGTRGCGSGIGSRSGISVLAQRRWVDAREQRRGHQGADTLGA